MHTEYYMVHDHVWQAAQAPERGYLCIGCLETRLGRQLQRGDSLAMPLNDTVLPPAREGVVVAQRTPAAH